MPVDIFIKSYREDFKWLELCLKSIKKYVTGYNEIIILIPEGDNFTPTTERTFVHKIKEEGNGYLFQQYCKMIAHNYSGADYIMYVDSDCIFHSPVNVKDLIVDGKPQILMTSYKELGNLVPWQKPTADFIGQVPEFEFMRRHCFIYHKKTLSNLLHWFKGDLKKYVLSRTEFSEFNAIGFYAYLFERDKYNFIDTKDWTYTPAIVNQYHSYTEYEAKVNEIKKIIE
jgi:glycosyltransferase involved in cell wall biosynthesis